MKIEILYCVLLLIIFFIALVYVVVANVLKNKKNKESSSTVEVAEIMEIVEVTSREFNMYTKESVAMHKYNSPVSERSFPEILTEGVNKARRDNFIINDKVLKGSGYYREL